MTDRPKGPIEGPSFKPDADVPEPTLIDELMKSMATLSEADERLHSAAAIVGIARGELATKEEADAILHGAAALLEETKELLLSAMESVSGVISVEKKREREESQPPEVL